MALTSGLGGLGELLAVFIEFEAGDALGDALDISWPADCSDSVGGFTSFGVGSTIRGSSVFESVE